MTDWQIEGKKIFSIRNTK